MTRNQVISKLETFETNQLKKKKAKSIAFQVEMLNSKSDIDDANDTHDGIKDVQKSLAMTPRRFKI